MIIDFKLLSDEALTGVIEAFVTLEGTDYGEIEYTLAEKVAQVKQQLQSNEATILFSEKDESMTIVPTHSLSATELD